MILPLPLEKFSKKKKHMQLYLVRMLLYSVWWSNLYFDFILLMKSKKKKLKLLNSFQKQTNITNDTIMSVLKNIYLTFYVNI